MVASIPREKPFESINTCEGQKLQAVKIFELNKMSWTSLVGIATSSMLAWRIPWTKKPGGLWSIASQSQARLKRLSTHAQWMRIRLPMQELWV